MAETSTYLPPVGSLFPSPGAKPEPKAYQELSEGGSAAGGLTSGKSLNETFSNFINLLTTQLKYQDPLKPMDSTKFTEQLVQFAGVEQSILGNQKLDKLVEASSGKGGNGLDKSLALIGRQARAVSNKLLLEKGESKFLFRIETVPTDAKMIQIDIRNSTGKVVRTIQTEPKVGTWPVTWDGKTEEGEALPSGVYDMRTSFRDSDDKTVQGDITTLAEIPISGVGTGPEGTEIVSGPLRIPLKDVELIFEPQVSPLSSISSRERSKELEANLAKDLEEKQERKKVLEKNEADLKAEKDQMAKQNEHANKRVGVLQQEREKLVGKGWGDKTPAERQVLRNGLSAREQRALQTTNTKLAKHRGVLKTNTARDTQIATIARTEATEFKAVEQNINSLQRDLKDLRVETNHWQSRLDSNRLPEG